MGVYCQGTGSLSALACYFCGEFVGRNSATQGCVSDDERRCPRYSKRFGEESDLL